MAEDTTAASLLPDIVTVTLLAVPSALATANVSTYCWPPTSSLWAPSMT